MLSDIDLRDFFERLRDWSDDSTPSATAPDTPEEYPESGIEPDETINALIPPP